MRFVLRVADFYAANRGGGIYSEAISQRLGAVIALYAARLRLPPTVITLVGLAISVGASALHEFGVIALLGWQVAYAMDCADGQLARVTGRASPAGARVDVLADVVSHVALTVALAAVARPPLWLAVVFAGTWMVNVITSVLGGAPMVRARLRLIKVVRDYGAIVLVAGLILMFAPTAMIWFVWFYALVNTAFLLVSLIHAARAALAG